MAAFEDDDEGTNSRYGDAAPGGARSNDDSWDKETPADADVSPDDFDTVKCGWCKKFIFEDSVRCPYCKHLQLEKEQNARPTWVKVTAIVCLIAFAFSLILGFFKIMTWLYR